MVNFPLKKSGKIRKNQEKILFNCTWKAAPSEIKIPHDLSLISTYAPIDHSILTAFTIISGGEIANMAGKDSRHAGSMETYFTNDGIPVTTDAFNGLQPRGEDAAGQKLMSCIQKWYSTHTYVCIPSTTAIHITHILYTINTGFVLLYYQQKCYRVFFVTSFVN